MKEKFIKAFRFLQNCIEIYIPSILFLVVFFSFCLQIFTRYFFDFQYEWTYESSVLGYMWVSILAACYAGRIKDHVTFTLLYEKLSYRMQQVITMIGNGILLAAFFLMFKPCMEYIDFMAIKTTPIFKITFRTAYLPFMVFLLFSTLYLIRDTVQAAIAFVHPPKPQDNSEEEGTL